jgi:hypothetical protein
MNSNQIPLKSLHFPKKWKSTKNPACETIGGPQLPPLRQLGVAASTSPFLPLPPFSKNFQSSSSLLKPVTRLVCLQLHRWHCYCLGNFLNIVDPITRVNSGIGFWTDLGSRIYPVIGQKELTRFLQNCSKIFCEVMQTIPDCVIQNAWQLGFSL